MPDDLWRLSATALGAGYRSGSFTPEEVLSQCLGWVVAHNGALNAIICLDEAGARAAARESAARWNQGAPLGALDGVPITVKDNIFVRGLPTTWGSRIYAAHVPDKDELPIARLRAGGAVIMGKTNVPEFTMQGYTDNLLFGPTRNPWNTALTPGGSSGGAVASVSAGFCPVAIGTDGGGSIRRPASHTGLVGFKPSRGRVPRCDGLPPIFLDYEAIGPMTRTVDDAIAVTALLAAPDARDPASEFFTQHPFAVPATPGQCRILYAPRFGDSPVDGEIAASVDAAAQCLRALGHRVDEAPVFTLADKVNAGWPRMSQAGLAWLLHERNDWQGKLTAGMQSAAETGLAMPARELFDVLIAVAEMRAALGAVFSDHDFILTPSAAALPWPAAEAFPPVIAGQHVGPRGHAVFTAFANAAGLPAISLPCAPSKSGLPIGFHLVGRHAADNLLLALARQYEQAHPWQDRWPALDTHNGQDEQH